MQQQLSNMFALSLLLLSLLLLLHTALVKVLRRCVRDMASKSSGFVELCVKLEKEAAQEVSCSKNNACAPPQQFRQGQQSRIAEQLLATVCKMQQARCACECTVYMLAPAPA
jgi:hypothetical protein